MSLITTASLYIEKMDRRAIGLNDSLIEALEQRLSTPAPYQDALGVHLPRHYHTVEHAVRVFAESRNLGSAFYNNPNWIPASFAFAAYHDVLYVAGPPGSSENASADYFLRHVRDGLIKFDPFWTATITHGIVASAGYGSRQPNLPLPVQVWLDADLLGLADEWCDYAQTTVNVRREFFGTEDDQFVAGRRNFLKMMIQRCKDGGLYYVAEDYTADAAENLMRELDYLESGWSVSKEGWRNPSGEIVEFDPIVAAEKLEEDDPDMRVIREGLANVADNDVFEPNTKFDAATEADLLKGLEKTVVADEDCEEAPKA